MAKQQITANGQLDILTATELRDSLKSWQTELTRGARMRRHAINGQASAGGVLLIGGNEDGPAEGMIWAITRFSIAPGPTIPATGIQVYANTNESPASLIISSLVTDVFPGDRGCVLNGGGSLRIAGTGLAANDDVTVTMAIKEVPIQQAWSL